MKPYSDLIEQALAVRAFAYAPYSSYVVGAALRASDGRTFTGANVENAVYGLALCAERAAVLAAVNAGARAFEAIAIATASSPPAAPCGACRQVLAEFAEDMAIVLTNEQGERRDLRLSELLPSAFRAKDIGKK